MIGRRGKSAMWQQAWWRIPNPHPNIGYVWYKISIYYTIPGLSFSPTIHPQEWYHHNYTSVGTHTNDKIKHNLQPTIEHSLLLKIQWCFLPMTKHSLLPTRIHYCLWLIMHFLINLEVEEGARGEAGRKILKSWSSTTAVYVWLFPLVYNVWWPRILEMSPWDWQEW